MKTINPELFTPMEYSEGYELMGRLTRDKINLLLTRPSFNILYARIGEAVNLMCKFNLGQFSVFYKVDKQVVVVRLFNCGTHIEIIDGKILRKVK